MFFSMPFVGNPLIVFPDNFDDIVHLMTQEDVRYLKSSNHFLKKDHILLH